MIVARLPMPLGGACQLEAAGSKILNVQCTHGNLGDRAQNSRLRMALVFLSLSLILEVYLIRIDAEPLVRTVLFIPFFGAAFGAFQGLYRTCSYAAKEGMRVTDAGQEIVADSQERELFKKRGRTVMALSFMTAFAATTVSVFV
jgi:hypothetical protein